MPQTSNISWLQEIFFISFLFMVLFLYLFYMSFMGSNFGKKMLNFKFYYSYFI